MSRPVLSFIVSTALLAGISAAKAGQTGAFSTVAYTMWACSDEKAIARVMAAGSPGKMRSTAKEAGNCTILQPGTKIWVHGGNALIEWGGVDGFSQALYYPVAGTAKVTTTSSNTTPTTSYERVSIANTDLADNVNSVRLGNASGRTGKFCKAGISTLMGTNVQAIYSGKIAEQDGNDIFKLVYWRDDGEMFSYHCLLKGSQIVWKKAPGGRWRIHPLDEKLWFDEVSNGSVTITMTSGDESRVFKTKTFRSESL